MYDGAPCWSGRPHPGQLTLGSQRDAPHQGQGDRCAQLVAPGDVDETQHVARVRVSDGRRGTRPGLHDLAEVLGRGDLHRALQGDGGARCVGPGRALVPRRALDEVHVLGPAPQHRMPLDPEQPCAGVAHRHQVPCLRRDPPQQLAEQRQQLDERAALPVTAQLRSVQLHRRPWSAPDRHPRRGIAARSRRRPSAPPPYPRYARSAHGPGAAVLTRAAGSGPGPSSGDAWSMRGALPTGASSPPRPRHGRHRRLAGVA